MSVLTAVTDLLLSDAPGVTNDCIRHLTRLQGLRQLEIYSCRKVDWDCEDYFVHIKGFVFHVQDLCSETNDDDDSGSEIGEWCNLGTAPTMRIVDELPRLINTSCPAALGRPKNKAKRSSFSAPFLCFLKQLDGCSPSNSII